MDLGGWTSGELMHGKIGRLWWRGTSPCGPIQRVEISGEAILLDGSQGDSTFRGAAVSP